MTRQPILYAAAAERGRAFAERWRGHQPAYWCVLGHTDTCLIPGLSAAGVSEELRPLTPAADAEVVLLGSPRCLPHLPSNPLGAPGPSGITHAALQLAGLEAGFVGSGLRVWPATACIRIDGAGGANIETGNAVPHAQDLFATGLELGRGLAQTNERFVIAESVPGGTTTALAVLLALGYHAEGRVSGSQRGNAHLLKSQVVRRAFEAANLRPGDGRAAPLMAIASVGDPMQPIVAGLVHALTSRGKEVLLAGGSQMLAVAALLAALGGPAALERVAIGTTRWIVDDPDADVPGLASDVDPRLAVLAINLDFTDSPCLPLRAYEAFLVKEGVGAGGACIAAVLANGLPIERLEAAIVTTYDQMP
jgi:uncharacterized protein (TIGR00303 family)